MRTNSAVYFRVQGDIDRLDTNKLEGCPLIFIACDFISVIGVGPTLKLEIANTIIKSVQFDSLIALLLLYYLQDWWFLIKHIWTVCLAFVTHLKLCFNVLNLIQLSHILQIFMYLWTSWENLPVFIRTNSWRRNFDLNCLAALATNLRTGRYELGPWVSLAFKRYVAQLSWEN